MTTLWKCTRCNNQVTSLPAPKYWDGLTYNTNPNPDCQNCGAGNIAAFVPQN
jgi:hypothetical protein